ncbi:MAG: ABC transporter permease [Chloroflexi bacterium]|nr:ABC transporter permease [Chloroflexota bacterium]
MNALILKAYRDITRRKLRSLLTISGILIGVAGIIAIISASKNMADAQAQSYNNASQADVTIRTTNAPDGLRSQLMKIPNVADVELRAVYFTKWKVGDVWKDIYFTSFKDYSDLKVDKISLWEGRFPRKGQVTLERSVKEVNAVPIGEEIAYRAYSGDVLRNRYLQVVGYATTPSYASASVTNISLAYANIEDVRYMLGIDGNNEIKIRLVSFGDRDKTIEDVRRLLAQRNLKVLNLEVRDPDNYPGKRELDSVLAMMLMFSAVGLLVSGFLVANTLSAIIGEQVGEIGIMKALGATRGQVLPVYLLQAGLYGVVGTFLGSLLGWLGGSMMMSYLNRFMNLDTQFSLDPMALLAGGGIGIGVTVLSGLLPALAGTSMTVREAMATYGISFTYGKGIIDRFLAGITLFPPLAALSFRNLARRKARTVVTLLVIALSTASFLAARTVDISLNATIDKLYAVYGVDAFVWFEKPVSEAMDGPLRSLTEVERAEQWAFSNGVIKNTNTRLRGMPSNTVLYRKLLEEGRWFSPGERDAIVVSSDLAKRADIRLGDMVEVETATKTAKFRVVGIVFDSSTQMGSTATGNALLPVRELAGLYDRRGSATLFALKMDDSSPLHIDQVLGKLEKKFRGLNPTTYSMEADRATTRNLLKIPRALVYGTVFIVGIIGGIGILNTLTLGVMERRREIGVMRSIGASDSHLIQIFLAEGLFMGLLGALLGVAMGYPLARFYVDSLSNVLFQLEFFFREGELLTTISYTMFISTAASLIPAWGAAQFSTSDALRYE